MGKLRRMTANSIGCASWSHKTINPSNLPASASQTIGAFVLAQVQRCLSLVVTHRRVPLPAGYMLAGNEEAIGQAGALLWPRLASAYLDARLAGAKPADGADGETFQRAAAAATAFEDAAARAGWVPSVGAGARTARRGRIHSYVKHALNRYLHAKRLRSAWPQSTRTALLCTLVSIP